MSDSEESSLENLLDYLRQSRGFDFTGYKRSSLARRITRRLSLHGLDNFNQYCDYLQVHPEEFFPLFNTILINVTSFLRDTVAWQYLETQILPALIAPQPATLRVWSAGCASGEEAYTIAMMLASIMGMEQFRQTVKIYATDVDEAILSQARQATYSPEILESLPTAWREQYFDPVNEKFVVCSDLRRSVIFGRHDLLQDAPISRLDLLLCRNTLMYFNAETQAKVLNRFHFALQEQGILFLGKAEMLLTYSHLFMPISLQHRLFRRLPKTSHREQLFSSSWDKDIYQNTLNGYVSLREATFETAPVPQIVVDSNGCLVLVNAQARSLFGIERSDQGRPLQDLEISYRPVELRSPIQQVYHDQKPMTIANVERQLNDNTQHLDIQIIPLHDENMQVIGVSIVFIDVTSYYNLRAALNQTNQELAKANEQLQSSNEELETTNEELQSTNEELETTNEELQSTNEELETINEEMQSTNEELQTINDELRDRTNDLHHANAFLQSILTSLKAGVVVLDTELKILSWNHEAQNLWGMSREEVKGISLFVLDIGLPVEQLRTPILNCLQGQIEQQDVILSATNRRGRSIQCQVSINPLVDRKQERQGILLLMEDVNHDQTL